MTQNKIAVIAIGGNSLIKDSKHQSVEDQYEAARETCVHIADMIEAGYEVVIGHGNGPQVGFILRRSEIAAKVEGMHEVPLDVCGADSQGAIGYEFQQALQNELALLSETRTALSAFNALAPLWRAPAIDRLNEKLPLVKELKRQAEKRGLQLTTFTGSIDDLLRLDSPALLPLTGKGATGGIIVALTGYGRDEDKERARDAGFDHHMTKPIDVAALSSLVNVLGVSVIPSRGAETTLH